eukprot:jgi/Tetstr1/431391/TSEL_021081.t1
MPPAAETSPSEGQPGVSAGDGAWVLERQPRPRLTFLGGQAAFPGGWLELAGEALRDAAARLAPPVATAGPNAGGEPQRTDQPALRPLRWLAREQLYVEAPESYLARQGEELRVSAHCLDQSPGVLELADTVGRWRDEVAARTAAAGEAADGEGHLYVQIATALGKKLAGSEDDAKQDYASEVLAMRSAAGELLGVVDCYERRKTRALILKYALAHPQSQRPGRERADGALGGLGRACLGYLAGRAAREGHRCVRMEALSLRLYLSAASLGYTQLGTTVPPLPAGAFRAEEGAAAPREAESGLSATG